MVARRTVIFLIRDKFGDSLIAANVALVFARAHPEWAVSVLIRDAYGHALAGEPLLDVIPYRSGCQAQMLAWWWRITGRCFDVLGVMRGFGKRTMDLVKRIPARRVVVHDSRLAGLATEVATAPDAATLTNDPHYGPALRVARVLDANLPAPRSIRFEALANRWQSTVKKYIVICPLSDEQRRNIPADAIDSLYEWLRARHPDLEVRVLVRTRKELRVFSRKLAAHVLLFNDIPGLCRILLQSSQFYGTDTGLLHLAAAMGLPCTVFFGPTQPHLVLPSEQPDMIALRAPTLGIRHCDIKTCTSAACITQAVNQFIGQNTQSLELTLPECPLRGRQAGGGTTLRS